MKAQDESHILKETTFAKKKNSYGKAAVIPSCLPHT